MATWQGEELTASRPRLVRMHAVLAYLFTIPRTGPQPWSQRDLVLDPPYVGLDEEEKNPHTGVNSARGKAHISSGAPGRSFVPRVPQAALQIASHKAQHRFEISTPSHRAPHYPRYGKPVPAAPV